MTVVGNSDIQAALKAAAADIKESVAKHGNVHPIVLQKVEAYIQLLEQAGNQAEVAKWQERAGAMRKLIAQQQPKPEPVVEAPKPEAPKPEAPKLEAPKPEPPAPKPEALKAAPKPQPTEDGVFSLDDSDEEEVSDEALEAAVARSKEYTAPPAPAQTAAPDLMSDEAVMLYSSGGDHVAVAWRGYLYDPEGKNLGRYQDDFECFVDRGGHYLGQIHDGNRLVKDHNFRYAHFNFGDKGNEGDKPGWGRTPDIERTSLPTFLDDVSFHED